MNSKIDSNPYTFFDGIFCISLKHRSDRHESVSRVFERIGITNMVKLHLVEKSPLGGMYGCFESHIQVIKSCYEQEKENILIFEDDMFPTPSYSLEKIKLGVDFMKFNNYDIFYFGCFPINEKYDNIFRARSFSANIIEYRPNATHAYCLSRRGMRKVLEQYVDYIGKFHLDYYYTLLQLNSYCMIPILFDQHLCLPHDNEAKQLNHIIARRAQCFIEKTALNYHITYIVWIYKLAWWSLVLVSWVLMILVIIYSSH